MIAKAVVTILAATFLYPLVSLADETAPTGVSREWYREIFSGNITHLREIIKENQVPSGNDILPDFEALPFYDHMSRKNTEQAMDMKEKGEKDSKHPPMGQLCGQRLRAYLVPDASGEYVFFLSACARGELYLSTDEKPENARSIIRMMGPSKMSAYSRPDQQSSPIKLAAGKKYYIEAIMAERKLWEPDHLSVAWRMPPVANKTNVNTTANDDILDSIREGVKASSAEAQELITGKNLRPIESVSTDKQRIKTASKASEFAREAQSGDEPDQLSWEFFAGNPLVFEHYKEWAKKNPPPQLDTPALPDKFPLTWIRAEALKSSDKQWGLTYIYKGEKGFERLDANEDVSTMREHQKEAHLNKLAQSEKVFCGPAGHNWTSNNSPIEIKEDATYRIWIRYFHNNAQARGFTVSIEQENGIRGVSHSFDRNPFRPGFDRKPKLDMPDGFAWESFPSTVILKKGKYTLKLNGEICNGFAATAISAIVFSTDPGFVPESPPSKDLVFNGFVPPSEATKKDWTLLCSRPGAFPFDQASAELQRHWLKWRRDFLDKLATYNGKDYNWAYLASMLYFDEERNLIARPSQIASQARCDDKDTFFAGLTGKDFKSDESAKSQEWKHFVHDSWGYKQDGIKPESEKSECFAELEMPREGEYYIWLKYSYQKDSSFKLIVSTKDEKPLFEKELNSDAMGGTKTNLLWADFVAELPVGKLKIVLQGKNAKKEAEPSAVTALIITNRSDFNPDKYYDISDGEKIGTQSTAYWLIPDPWGAVSRFSPPGQLVQHKHGLPYVLEPLDAEMLNPAEIKLEARRGELISQLVILRNNQDKPLKITPGLDSKIPASLRLLAYTLTGNGNWSPMPLLKRKTIIAPALQNTGIWVSIDCRNLKDEGVYPLTLSLGENKIRFEITVKGSILEAPVPIVGAWANPYPRTSSWDCFADIGINLLYGTLITKEQMNKYRIKHITAMPHPDFNELSPESIRKAVERIKNMGLDYSDWSWYPMDEPGEKALPKWLKIAQDIKSVDPRIMLWCNVGEPHGVKFETVMKTMPFWDVSCPYIDHFKVAERPGNAEYKEALDKTGKIKLLYTTPCLWWNERRSDAPHDMLELGEYTLKYKRDGWAFFNLIYGEIWNDPYGGNQDGGVAIYPASHGGTFSSRYMEAIREAIQRWKKAKLEEKNAGAAK